MKDPCALVSYCCKVNDTENKLRKEVLDGISETIEDIRSHDGLGALDCENKNVFLIRNCEFEGFKLGRFAINETDKSKCTELAERILKFFDFVKIKNSCYIELTPYGISIYAKFKLKTKLVEKRKIYCKTNLHFNEAGRDDGTNNFVMVAPTNIPCMTGDLIFTGISHNNLKTFIEPNKTRRICFEEPNTVSNTPSLFSSDSEFINICHSAYLYAIHDDFVFTSESGETISTINPITKNKLQLTDEQIRYLLEDRPDVAKLTLINKEIIKQSNLIYDEISNWFYDDNCNSYSRESLVNNIITNNYLISTKIVKNNILSLLDQQGLIEKKDICKMRMEKRIESVQEYTYSIEKFCARVGFDLYETENMKRVLCALVQKQLNPETVFQQVIYFVSKHQGVGKTLFWQAIAKELNPTNPKHTVSKREQPRDLAAFARETPILLFDEAKLTDADMNDFLNNYSSDDGITYRVLYSHSTATAVKRSIPVIIANHVTGSVLFSQQIEARRPWIFDFSRNDIERNTFKAFHYKKGNPKHGKVTAKNLIDDACYLVKSMSDCQEFECGDNPERKIYTELRNKYYMESDSLDCQVELRLHDIIDYAKKHRDIFYWHKTKTGEYFPAICLTPQKWAQLLHDGYVSGIDTKQKGDKADDDVFKYSASRFARVSLSVKTIINRILVKFPTGYNDSKTLCDSSCGYRKSFRGIPIWELLNEFQNQIMKPKPEKYVYRGTCYDYEKDFVYVTKDGEIFEREASENKFFDEDVVEYECLKVESNIDLLKDKKENKLGVKTTESTCSNKSSIAKNAKNKNYSKRVSFRSKRKSILASILCNHKKQENNNLNITKNSSFDEICNVLNTVINQNEKNFVFVQQLEDMGESFSDSQREALHKILSKHQNKYGNMVFDVDFAVKPEDEELEF